MKAGIRSLLRSEIMRMHHTGIKEGFASTLDREIMQRNYDAYHDLGGNGVATKLYDEYRELPTVDDPKEQARLRREAYR